MPIVHTTDTDETRLSCLVLSVSAVWTELATSRLLGAENFETASKCDVNRVLSCLDPVSYLQLELFPNAYTADRTGQNCSVSDMLKTTENNLDLSPVLFTPPTRCEQCIRKHCYTYLLMLQTTKQQNTRTSLRISVLQQIGLISVDQLCSDANESCRM